MSNLTCLASDCDRDLDGGSKGYCRPHYRRVQKHGDPQEWKPLRKLPKAHERDDVVGRIMAQVVTTERGCLEWQGYKMQSGYGTIHWRDREWVVHRAMWTATVGPIPCDDDWTLDHLCSNRACVNVGHLEVVTRTENSERGGGLLIAQRANRERWDAATQCRNGHEWTDENTGRLRQGKRYCKTCKRAAWARQADKVYARRKAARIAAKATG